MERRRGYDLRRAVAEVSLRGGHVHQGRARDAAENERQTRGAKGKREWRGEREREEEVLNRILKAQW